MSAFAGPLPVPAFSVTFPGMAAIVPSARRFVSGILAGCPLTILTGEDWARVEVHDTGTGKWTSPPDEDADAEYGRGIAIINALADKFGHDVDAAGQTVWAEVNWTAKP